MTRRSRRGQVSLETAVTLTTFDDIGVLIAEIVLFEPTIRNEIVFLACDTVTPPMPAMDTTAFACSKSLRGSAAVRVRRSCRAELSKFSCWRRSRILGAPYRI